MAFSPAFEKDGLGSLDSRLRSTDRVKGIPTPGIAIIGYQQNQSTIIGITI
jgi:hypothetical protein